jgi:hypothetical protein|tara:strand:- start:268 stop:690 length:423 start_codon:yes stop_codon:yes gene_type:complete
MQNSADVVRMAGGNPNFIKRFGKYIPLLGDLANIALYLAEEDEPSPEQRFRNAVIIGGGGALASLATGGLDVIPAIVQGLGEAGEAFGLPKTDADPLFQAAPLLNVENYLREYSYSMDPDINIPESQDKLRRYKEYLGIN